MATKAVVPRRALISFDSSSRYPVKLVRHVKILMRDGIGLAADLFMPNAEGRFPVVLEYLPYRKDDRTLPRQNLHYALAQRGYVGCRLDVRGTGSSEGVAEDEYTLAEQLDGCEAIGWLAEQPWSSGKVGMWGISYGGFNAVQVAMHRPPALKAIVPVMFTDDRYKEECHYAGGSPRALYTWSDYPLMMVALNALPPHPEACEGDWLERWRERLERQPAWLLRWLREQTDGAYWHQGSLNRDYQAIECAVYAIGGWRDGYPSSPLRAFAHLKAPKKVLMGPWTHLLPHETFPGPKIDYFDEALRFFDYWLKGIDNGIMSEPPVTFYVQEHDKPAAMPDDWRGYWRTEGGWPQESQELQLHLGHNRRLLARRPDEEGSDAFDYEPTVGIASGIWCWATPVDQRPDDARSLLYESEPLEEALEIGGEPVLEVAFSATAETAGLSVHLNDVAPNGTAVLVSKGYLNATRRASFEAPEPLEAGKVYQLTITLDCTAWRFRPGHRLRLSLAGTEWPNIWPTPYPSRHACHWGGAHTARLRLPLLPPATEAQKKTFSPPTPLQPVAESQAEAGAWQVTQDVMSERVSVFCHKADRLRSLLRETAFASAKKVTATASNAEPADVRVTGENAMELRDHGHVINAVAAGAMTGTAETFHVSIELEVTLDGRKFFGKRWDEAIPRKLM
jgi:uncharacterized protein